MLCFVVNELCMTKSEVWMFAAAHPVSKHVWAVTTVGILPTNQRIVIEPKLMPANMIDDFLKMGCLVHWLQLVLHWSHDPCGMTVAAGLKRTNDKPPLHFSGHIVLVMWPWSV